MRNKIIKRFAAGTIGICFAYALIRQPFEIKKDDNVQISNTTSALTEATTQPDSSVFNNALTDQYEDQGLNEQSEAELEEDKGLSEQENDEELQSQQTESGGDVPTLSQFLSNLTCGGCRHNCLLVSPRCMKGRSKAQSATEEYYETYGQ